MQGHNSPVWLSLENHVLRNADKDNQKVSVLTGPVLSKKDPILYGVKIPVQIWKIVAFPPNAKALASVAYLDSQAEFLPEKEGQPAFVWGEFKGMQVPVSRIEKLTGLSFGSLRKADVLDGADASYALEVQQVHAVLDAGGVVGSRLVPGRQLRVLALHSPVGGDRLRSVAVLMLLVVPVSVSISG